MPPTTPSSAQPKPTEQPRRSSVSPGREPSGEADPRRCVLSWTVSLLLVLVLGVDWVFALRGMLSYGLAIAAGVLTLPWTYLLFRAPRAPSLAQRASVSEQRQRQLRLRAMWLRSALLLTALSLHAAKWVVLGHADATAQEYLGSARSYTLATALVLALGIVSHDLRWSSFFASVSAHPARLLATSFGATGMVGALLLSLPIAHETVSRVSLTDSLFMAFSAVCITGLAVNNLAETYSLFGQVVLCLLVQIGGLGMMVLSAAIAILMGQRLKVRSSAVLTEIVDGSSLANLRRTVLTICAYTLLVEAACVTLLYLQFREYPEIATRYGSDLSGASSVLWAAVFHGVSAFCNAGFSNFAEGLIPLRGHGGVLGVIAAGVLLGGIGFPVLDELSRAAWTKLRRRRATMLSLHTRIVLILSAALLGGMAVAYLLLEWNNALYGLPYHERLLAALFQSVAARTAGFNVVDLATFLPASLALTCAAMFIGAGPGSTAGGIKVTTAAALFAGFRAELTGNAPSLLNRVLPETVIRKAIGVASLSLVIVGVAFFSLLLVEPHAPLDLLFEVVSAFSTAGLSTGLTPKLSIPGKLIILAMMFIGRIGPLTLALAVSYRAPARALRLPEERVLIG